MSTIITCNRLLGNETVIPECVFVGHVRNNPWTFCYYDMDKIEEVLKKYAAEQLGFSIDGLYWDGEGTLFSEEEEFDEADYEYEPIASYKTLEIEDAWDYADELDEMDNKI